MAKMDRIQSLVVDIAEKIPGTDNVRVFEDLADVALALPPGLAARLAPKLARALGLPHQIDALALFSGVLADAVRLSTRGGDERKPDDYSSVWRPAIEERGGRGDRDVRDALVSAVHDVADALVRENRSPFPEVVATLERHGWNVFQRITLQLLLDHAPGDMRLIRERLTRRDLFDESEVRREYRALARRHFAELPPEDRGLILGWIAAGPDRELVKRSFEAWEGRPPTDEEIALRVKAWQLDHLAPISEALTDEWKTRYEELVGELGPPSASDFAA